MPSTRMFKTKVVEHTRAFDAEVFVLENIAKDLPASSRGRIRLFSERAICPSCEAVIKQFKKAFPNIKLIVTSGPK